MSLIEKNKLGPKIIEDLYDKALSIPQIVEKYGVSYSEVQKFLSEHKLRVYNDEKLEAVAMSDEFNPLSVVLHFFQSVHHASKELAFTGLVAQQLRAELADKLARQGVDALDSNPKLVAQWKSNADQLTRQVANAPKMLTSYFDLFNKILDVQREVSYVKIITDLLRREDPELYRKIQRALDADPAAKQVLESLSREDVLEYWDSTSGRVVREINDLYESTEEDY